VASFTTFSTGQSPGCPYLKNRLTTTYSCACSAKGSTDFAPLEGTGPEKVFFSRNLLDKRSLREDDARSA
jgi:hypothetical protein